MSRHAIRREKRMWSIASRRRNRRHKSEIRCLLSGGTRDQTRRLLKPVATPIAMKPIAQCHEWATRRATQTE